MGRLLRFLIVVAIIFFGIGEWQGWYVGVAGQTPLLVYKKDYVAQASRRTVMRNEMPVNITGNVQNGSVTVKIHYERPASIQTSAAALPERVVFERTWNKGQRIALNELVDQGRGNYRTEITFENATGMFNLKLPTSSEL